MEGKACISTSFGWREPSGLRTRPKSTGMKLGTGLSLWTRYFGGTACSVAWRYAGLSRSWWVRMAPVSASSFMKARGKKQGVSAMRKSTLARVTRFIRVSRSSYAAEVYLELNWLRYGWSMAASVAGAQGCREFLCDGQFGVIGGFGLLGYWFCLARKELISTYSGSVRRNRSE